MSTNRPPEWAENNPPDGTWFRLTSQPDARMSEEDADTKAYRKWTGGDYYLESEKNAFLAGCAHGRRTERGWWDATFKAADQWSTTKSREAYAAMRARAKEAVK